MVKWFLYSGFYLFGRSRSFFGFERADGWCESAARGFEGSPSYSERTAVLLFLIFFGNYFLLQEISKASRLIRIRRVAHVTGENEG